MGVDDCASVATVRVDDITFETREDSLIVRRLVGVALPERDAEGLREGEGDTLDDSVADGLADPERDTLLEVVEEMLADQGAVSLRLGALDSVADEVPRAVMLERLDSEASRDAVAEMLTGEEEGLVDVDGDGEPLREVVGHDVCDGDALGECESKVLGVGANDADL